MKINIIVSSVALAAMFSMPGAALAQNMLDGAVIPADQIHSFKGKCEALQAASTASLAGSVVEDTDALETGSVNGSNADSDPAARDNWDEALASLTLEQCESAGLME